MTDTRQPSPRCDVVIVDYGLIREHHFYWDQLEFLGQLGLLPEGNK
jgi:hypothetical protein